MNIIMTDVANISVFIVPIVPAEASVTANGANSTDNTLGGKVRIIDNCDLRSYKWTSFFPVNKNYSFAKKGSLSNGWEYVTFIELMRRLKLPIRIIGTTSKKIPLFNLLTTIDEFNFSVDKVGDINYTISLTEFPEDFFDFINRDVRVYKYIKKYLKQKDKVNSLKEKGLINFRNFLQRFKEDV